MPGVALPATPAEGIVPPAHFFNRPATSGSGSAPALVPQGTPAQPIPAQPIPAQPIPAQPRSGDATEFKAPSLRNENQGHAESPSHLGGISSTTTLAPANPSVEPSVLVEPKTEPSPATSEALQSTSQPKETVGVPPEVVAASTVTPVSKASDDQLKAASRVWTDDTGKFQITARLVAVQEGHVKLMSSAGHLLNVPIYRLSLGDIAFVRQQQPSIVSPGQDEPISQL
jgi:hypothetical protein